MSDPTILAFDTSGPFCDAAIWRDGRIVSQAHAQMSRGQAEALMPLVADLMQEAGIGRRHLSAVAVGTGPGNFTGLRISVAAARGMALALGIPAIGIDWMQVLADAVAGQACLAVLPAPRDAIYAQKWGFGAASLADESSGPDGPVHLLGLNDPLPAMPERAEPVTVAPQSAVLPKRSWSPCLARMDGPDKPAAAIARLAAERLASGAPQDRPAPLYIRAPDAAPARHQPPVRLP